MNDFSNILIEWYKDNYRDLPWRKTTDPYIIWISEIILQQTRVVQGYDYFVRFIRRFPDVKTLAEADEDEVLKYWQGLGYYSRARNLHEAAKSMAGEFPSTYEGVRGLKGVGDYTAAAVCSISFNLPYAVVDGNVYRVLARWLGIDIPIDTPQGKKQFAEVASGLLNRKLPGLHNQAVMEFGALQCTPQNPACGSCPLSGSCIAFHEGRVTALPVKKHKVVTFDRYFNYIYVRMGANTLINKRRGNDIWKNLYELPLIETTKRLTEGEFLACREFNDIFPQSELITVNIVKRGVKHVLSHRIIYTDFYEVVLPEDYPWVSGCSYLKIKREELENYAVSKLVHSLIGYLAE